MSAPALRIGVDVGGTNTDAVLMDGRRVAAWTKTPTTPDVTGGIATALQRLLGDHDVEPTGIASVMIGTTHFVNALVERKGLMATAAIRLGSPATASLPPLVDWPDALREAIGDRRYLCRGGHEYDGREISPLDPDELAKIADELATAGVRSVAITSVFSPVNAELEERAAELIRKTLPDAAFSLSHELGRIGLLERENATVVNASLRDLAERIVRAFGAAVADLGIDAPIYISQNDGTLMSADYARRYPVATFASGPTNSMRGAAFLSQMDDGAVVDVGGTTLDVGMLVHGFPRDASSTVDVGDVRTNFRMPDVVSIGLGGGSIVRLDGGAPTIGPDSVGYQLTDRALVFGGDTITATDVAVAAGMADIGDASLVEALDRGAVSAAVATMQRTVAEAVDRMKTRPEPVPVVIVGGGSILVEPELAGAATVDRPEHYAVANAIGAAIAQVGSEVDRVFALAGGSRDAMLDEARDEAVRSAVEAGAAPGTVEIVEVEELPLAYLPSNAVRVRVKAVGDLRGG